jgi:hypothetical protein
MHQQRRGGHYRGRGGESRGRGGYRGRSSNQGFSQRGRTEGFRGPPRREPQTREVESLQKIQIDSVDSSSLSKPTSIEKPGLYNEKQVF